MTTPAEAVADQPSSKPEPRTVPLMPALKAAEAAARAPRRFAGWVVRVQN